MRIHPPPAESPQANKAAANLIAEMTKASVDGDVMAEFIKRVVDNRDREYQQLRQHFIAVLDRLNRTAQAMLATLRGDDRTPMDELVDVFVSEVDEEIRNLL